MSGELDSETWLLDGWLAGYCDAGKRSGGLQPPGRATKYLPAGRCRVYYVPALPPAYLPGSLGSVVVKEVRTRV